MSGQDEDAASVASSGPSAFSQSVKQRVAKLDGAYCWQCGATPVQICHVIGKKDNSFKRMVQDGVISFTTVGDPDNAIPLCGLCHANFDDISYPGFIFLPTDLQFFIDIEERNFAARKARLQATGQYQPRLSPSAEQYLVQQIQEGVIPENAIGGLYQRYTLRNYFPSEPGVTAPGLDTWIPGRGPEGPKHWHGAPMAAINRGLAVLGQLVWKNIGEEKGLLRRLQDLYERELPTNNTGTGAAAVGGGGSSGTGQEHGATGGNGQSSRSQAHPPAQPPPQLGVRARHPVDRSLQAKRANTRRTKVSAVLQQTAASMSPPARQNRNGNFTISPSLRPAPVRPSVASSVYPTAHLRI